MEQDSTKDDTNQASVDGDENYDNEGYATDYSEDPPSVTNTTSPTSIKLPETPENQGKTYVSSGDDLTITGSSYSKITCAYGQGVGQTETIPFEKASKLEPSESALNKINKGNTKGKRGRKKSK